MLPEAGKKLMAEKMEEDKEKAEQLRNLGWCVIVIWECQLKPKIRLESLEHLINEIVEG